MGIRDEVTVDRCKGRLKGLDIESLREKKNLAEDTIYAMNCEIYAIEELLGQFNLLSEDHLDEIYKLLDDGQYVGAIKRYRSITKLGLYEAKQAVDKLRDDWRSCGELTPALTEVDREDDAEAADSAEIIEFISIPVRS